MRTKSIAIVFLSLVLLVSLQHASAQKTWETFGRANGMVGDEVISMDYSGGELWVATTYIEPDVEEAPLEGEVPSALDPPPGCRFHTRCIEAKEICSQEEPVLKPVAEGHLVACHLA